MSNNRTTMSPPPPPPDPRVSALFGKGAAVVPFVPLTAPIVVRLTGNVGIDAAAIADANARRLDAERRTGTSPLFIVVDP